MLPNCYAICHEGLFHRSTGARAVARKARIQIHYFIATKTLVGITGVGTWAWGNKLVWGYNEGMDSELQEAFNLCVSEGINWFDTADSYG